MKTQFRLNSVVRNGVGSGPESGNIDLIYGYLLDEFGQSYYSYISINQIGDDLKELIMSKGKNIHINIRYPIYEDFDYKSEREKNLIRLDVVHIALCRIADFDKKFDIEKLNDIKSKILENDFQFYIICKTFVNKNNNSLKAHLVVQPEMRYFNYFVYVESNEIVLCKIFVHSGRTSLYFFDQYFQVGNWKSDNEVIITGKKKEVAVRVLVDTCDIELENLTSDEKQILFEEL